jgi:hypothetical protein
MTEEVGSKNLEYIRLQNKYKKEFEDSDVFQDIGNFVDMSQLELSKKLPKWKKIYNDENLNGNDWRRIKTLKKYCGDCDVNKMFFKTEYRDSTGHYRDLKQLNNEFWTAYRLSFRNLYEQAYTYFKETKAKNEAESKIKMEIHLKTEITCECGGKYSMRNKQKHLKTKKHVTFCQPCNEE